MNGPTATTVTPPRRAEAPIIPSPVRPTPPVVVEVVGGEQRPLQQICPEQRVEVLIYLDQTAECTPAPAGDCRIASEVSWWEASRNAEKAAVARIQAQRANGVAA